MDKRTNNGGARKGAGRKSKAAEQKLIENLTPMNSMALESLEKGLEKKEQWACKSGVSEFCVEITQDMLLPQGVTIADLQMNAFDSYETCVANSPCKKGREGAINESVIKILQKLAGIKK